MTRGLPSTFTDETQSDDPKPVILLAIETKDVGTPWIRICNFDEDVVFAGDTYTARPFDVSAVTIDGSDRPAIEIVLPDADFAFDTWLDTTEFQHHKIWLYRVERDALGSSTYTQKDLFRIRFRDRGHMVTRFHAAPLGSILGEIMLPRRVMLREDYPGMVVDRGLI